MGQLYFYTPSIWPSVLAVLLLIGLFIYSERQRGVPSALPFAIGCLFAALWAVGAVMEIAAVSIETKIFWFKFQALWILPTATAFTCFVLEYTWPGRWLTRRNLALLSIPCLIVSGTILTNDIHHLAWHGFVFDQTVIPLRGAGNWLFLVYGYGLGLVNLIIFIWLFLRSPQHRWPVAIMLAGLVLGRVLYMLEATRSLPPSLALSVPPMAFEYAMYAIALFGFRIFDPITLARQAAITQMCEGMLVLDPKEQVVDLNPAAERIFLLSGKRARGQPVGDLIPTYLERHLVGAEEAEIEVSLGREPETRNYLLEASSLKDWRGLEVGRLLLLHDVTGQKQAQAQLLEQQRALAMLQERDRLARELHDELSQELNFINLQAQACQALLESGRVAQASASIARLQEIARQTQLDIRELIGFLINPLEVDGDFVEALRRTITRFSQQGGVLTELVLEAGAATTPLEPEVGVQLLRITQEALTNIRKHACAEHVWVHLAPAAGGVELRIEDDGVGFDPQDFSAQASGFGLSIMQERSAEIGGVLQIFSVPGKGTSIRLQVPLGVPMVD